MHNGSSNLRAGAVLAANLSALATQWPLLKDHPEHVRFFVSGIRRARIAARIPLLEHLRLNLAHGRIWVVAKSSSQLIGYLPAWIGSFVLQLRARASS